MTPLPVAPPPEPPAARPADRRITLAGFALLLAAVLLLVLSLVRVPYVALYPGPTGNTLGTYNEARMITISGAPTYPSSGKLNFVTVEITGGPYGRFTASKAMLVWLDPHAAVVPEEVYFPRGSTTQQAEKQATEQMTASRSDAVTAAMRYLKIAPDGAEVQSVVKGSPAEGRFRPGDVVVSVDGVPVTSANGLRAAIAPVPVGTPVRLGVTRGGSATQVTLVTVANPDRPSVSYLGILPQDHFPVDVQIKIDGVGGPSAGLAFSLGIVEELTPADITAGRVVTATGTIEPDGTVGPIGGVEQKVVAAARAGSSVLLTPAGDCAAAARNPQPGLTLVKVRSLDDAIASLDALQHGRRPPTC